jgi:hypothetical protein
MSLSVASPRIPTLPGRQRQRHLQAACEHANNQWAAQSCGSHSLLGVLNTFTLSL